MTTIAPLPRLAPNPEAQRFLATRRSRPAKTLGPDAPPRTMLVEMLRLAVRCPDHGKLEPWRFVVVGRDAMAGIAECALRHATAAGLGEEAAEKAARSFTQGGAMVVVLASPKPSAKIPRWEQELSAGAVCLGLLNAALSMGWGANWLTGPLARDPGFLAQAFGAQGHEFAAGFVHIGSETVAPAERPRPDAEALTTWL